MKLYLVHPCRALCALAVACSLLAALPVCAASPAPKSGGATHDYTKHGAILWAQAGGRDLFLDVYSPRLNAQKALPVLIIYHGGGWLMNNRTIMDDMSAYVASHGDYVVVNTDYRLLGDGDSTTTIPEIVGDCLGALAWTKANIGQYGGDPGRIAVTGDSAGGHLAGMITLAGYKVGSKPYGGPDFTFVPTWLPKGTKAEDLDWSVQAMISSYGAHDFYGTCKGGFEGSGNGFWGFGNARAHQVIRPDINIKTHPEWYKGVSPLHLIPKAAERALPPILCAVGSNDMVVSPQSVKTFVAALNKAGHKQVTYREYPGKGHAYLDSGMGFAAQATEALNHMITFLDSVFK